MFLLNNILKYVLILLVIAGVVFGSYSLLHKSPVIPPSIKKQVNFVIFYPLPSSQTTLIKSSVKYNPSAMALSFLATHNGVSLTVSEQPTPQGFIDIPQAYDKLIESLNGYGSFESFNGKVDLTHPKEFNGQQSGAMNAKGTLLFAHATNGNLTVDQWKLFFNNLAISQ